MGTDSKNDQKEGNIILVEADKAATVLNSIDETESLDVPFIPVTVDENDVIAGARIILKAIRSHWDLNCVEFKLFTDGITNKLVGCFHNVKEDNVSSFNVRSNHDRNNDDTSSENVVLVRIYGNKTDLLIDRKAETRNIKLLHKYGFAPSLFAVFQNGLAYEYVPGDTLTPESVIKPEIWTLIAQRMAEMHKVDCERKKEPMLLKKMQQFLDLVPDKFSDPQKHKRIEKMFLPVSKLREEFNTLYAGLEKLNSPVVFCHNDLLLGNVIYTEANKKVTFIDYEYADYNFQAFDIGNHFMEFAGVDEIDYSHYPSKEFQLDWLRVYLQFYLSTKDVTSKDIENLYVQVNQFALASQFFWAIWGLIQAEHSTIDFDFIKFAQTRFNEYLAKKSTFLSLRCGSKL